MKRYASIAVAALSVLACAGWFVGAAHASDDAITKKVIEYYRRKANVPPSGWCCKPPLRPRNLPRMNNWPRDNSGSA